MEGRFRAAHLDFARGLCGHADGSRGSACCSRRWLPDHHLDEHARDIVRMGGQAGRHHRSVGSRSARSIRQAAATEAQRNEVRQIATDVILLDDLLEQYGSEAKPRARCLRRGCSIEMDPSIRRDHDLRTLAVTYGVGRSAPRSMLISTPLPTETAVKRSIVSQVSCRWRPISAGAPMLYERSKSTLPAPILIVPRYPGLTVCSPAIACLFSRVNPTSAVALVLGSTPRPRRLCSSILEMGGAVQRFMQISDSSIRTAPGSRSGP